MNTTKKTPETLLDAARYFADPAVALEFVQGIVWPDGATCPKCQSKDHYFLKSRQIWKCKACGKQFSIKAGTIMEDSPLGLDKWVLAIWQIANCKNGISSYELARDIGVTQKTAWFMDHRIRAAMRTGSFQKMSGTVEADETYIGGIVGNMSKSKRAALRAESVKLKPGRPPHIGRVVKKAIVAGILQRGNGTQPSQMRTEIVPQARRPTLQDFVKKNVEPNSMLMTDALASYTGLQDQYIHMVINHAVRYAEGRIHTNGTENFWSLLARAIKGTYVAVEPFHLTRYLDEQCFRFNNRKMNDAARFLRVLESVGGKRLTYAALIGETTTVCSSAGDGGVANA